jgi:alpha-mannosidase
MLKHRELTEQRIRQTGRRIEKLIYREPVELEGSYLPSDEPLSWEQVQDLEFKPIKTGEVWGQDFSCAWFRFSGTTPKTMAGCQVVALIDLDGEACLYDDKGVPVQGLTATYDDQHNGLLGPKREIKLFEKARAGQPVNLLLDAGANHLWQSTHPSKLLQAEIVIFNPLAWKVFHQFSFLDQLMRELPHNRHRQLLLRSLNDVCNSLTRNPEEGLLEAESILQRELMRPARHSSLQVSAIGHAHIDVAWLWPLRETVRKTARTFATALELMNEYPEYKFGASQPHLYQMMKDHHPGLYRKIKQAVKQGRWELQGAMWVESDTNIPSGESLVRQILYGKRFFLDEFNVDVTNLWLPDVFGYSAALPQILKKSGVDYFTTHKLNWNQFNEFPHHTLYWQGLDGSKVFSHFMAGNDYNVPCTPASFMNFESKNKDNDRTEHALCLFGIGDGGGGPGRTHIEWLNLATDLEDLPRVKPELAADFFTKAEQTSRDLLTWSGELYFEYHRGTYTSQALIKKKNRQMEQLLREVELAYSTLSLDIYPEEALEACWKVVLLNQFHDILPGSSINRVYREAMLQYEDVEKQLRQLLHDADAHWLEVIDERIPGDSLVIRNSLSWQRSDPVCIESAQDTLDRHWRTPDDETLACQQVEGGVLVKAPVAALGHLVILPATAASEQPNELKVATSGIENPLLAVEFGDDGSISRIYDKLQQREVLAEGKSANRFCLYEDRPITYDAWDIDAFYMETTPEHPVLLDSRVVEIGPLRGSIQQRWQGQDYTITQTISLFCDSQLIRFTTHVDWQQSHKMLRVEFPVNLRCSQASYEIQFGHVSRPTHMNTSWDMARFEVVGHRWADISQPDYGVAIINDCKYGHQILGNTISLNLLRSPKIPDPQADMHEHRFSYGLLPHSGDLYHSDVIHRAHEFNTPMRVVKAARAHTGKAAIQPSANNSFISLNNGEPTSVIIDCIKKAEEDQALIIRCYESQGTDQLVSFSFAREPSRIEIVDLIERSQQRIETTTTPVEISFSPFEIVTLKVRFR